MGITNMKYPCYLVQMNLAGLSGPIKLGKNGYDRTGNFNYDEDHRWQRVFKKEKDAKLFVAGAKFALHHIVRFAKGQELV